MTDRSHIYARIEFVRLNTSQFTWCVALLTLFTCYTNVCVIVKSKKKKDALLYTTIMYIMLGVGHLTFWPKMNENASADRCGRTINIICAQ